MLGPALGSFLFTAGGFVLPFEVVGSVGIRIAIFLQYLKLIIIFDKSKRLILFNSLLLSY